MNKVPEISWYWTIAAKASTLRERIEEPQRFIFSEADNLKLNQRRAEWQRMVATDNVEKFLIRLKNDDLTENDLNRLLGETTIRNEESLPGWIPIFRELMEYLCTYQPIAIQSDIEHEFGKETEKTSPFIHLVAPIVAFANSKFSTVVNDLKNRLLTKDASNGLNYQLARTILVNASQTFQLEFQVFISARHSSFERIFRPIGNEGVKDVTIYSEFVQNMLRDGWIPFFAEYCALARIIAIKVVNWITNTSQFLLRLGNDYNDIVLYFSNSSHTGRLIKYISGISDSHNQGKCVVFLKFESGLQLVYKPKRLELEQAFTKLLLWFNDKGLEPDLKPSTILQKGEYGWVEFIDAFECISEEEVSYYYKRIGALIGLIYLLNGNDCHQENLIASGQHPVIIDLETIMHHKGNNMVDEFSDSAVYLANQQFETSVLRTGLLPIWTTSKDDVVFDMSGIGGYGKPETHYRELVWKEINTDGMHFDIENYRFSEPSNLPVLHGKKHLPGQYTAEIVEGFTSLYHIALTYRQQIPVQLFAGKELRFIFRSTRIYYFIMKKVLDPKFMRDGVDRSIQLEAISRAFLHTTPPTPHWTICKSERRQMEETDFPIFWADSDNVDLKDSSGTIKKGFMCYPIFDRVVSRISELNEEDIAKQVKFIQCSLYLRELNHTNDLISVEGNIPFSQKTTAATRENLLKAAIDIAYRLNDEAIFSKDGSCSWITIGIIPGTNKYRMQPMGMYIYEGFAGVALFLSSLSTVSEDPVIQRLNEATLKSLRRTVNDMDKNSRYKHMNPIGIASGLSSLIYSFLTISALTKNSTLVDAALVIGRLIDKTSILHDNTHDIVSGSAGAILALLQLYRKTGMRDILDKANACGDHLLETITDTPEGNAGWITTQGKALAGFSHGTAGIAYALLKLYEATGNKEYYVTATKSIINENRLFSIENQNWADLRVFPEMVNPEMPKFMTAWCHGAPGIGLGRLAGKSICNNDIIESDIMSALTTTRTKSLIDRDHLCCGNMGRIDVILYAAQKNNDQILRNEAYEKAGFVIERAAKNGHYDTFVNKSLDFFNPGFFQGVSGIGYEFLRLAYPDIFPSVLVFE